jgi:signal transduction histidine kinase
MIRYAPPSGNSSSRKGLLGRMLARAWRAAGRALSPFFGPDRAAGAALADDYVEKRVTEAVARLAGGVAHDMNNILLVMQGYTDMALTEPETVPSVSALLREVNAANARAARLTRDLSLLARSGSPAPRRVDLNASLSALVSRLQQDFSDRAQAEWEPGSGLPQILVDETLLERALVLVFEWAFETGAGGVGIRTESAGSGETRGVRILFVVRGSSPGPELLARIFEPYAPGVDGGKGPGLRLALARTIVRRLGGTASADVAPGGGTLISISLPCGSPGP